MGTEETKILYDSLKSSGELKSLYSAMTGDWSKDRVAFKKQYDANEDLINGVIDGISYE